MALSFSPVAACASSAGTATIASSEVRSGVAAAEVAAVVSAAEAVIFTEPGATDISGAASPTCSARGSDGEDKDEQEE